MNRKFTCPFSVKDGVIFDANGKKVKLWGVNYYAPFNHNYFNLNELGKDHLSAVDRDIKHLKLLGVDFLRMHLYEREITKFDGHLVENHQMEVFDYLIDQCEKNGIYLMLAPICYWNTVKNQIVQDEQYAYWNIYSQDAFGFTNFYSIDSLLWHPEALDCQERYFQDLFAHKNRFSGKRLNEYGNIVAWELINEIIYPNMQLLENDQEITPRTMSAAARSRGKLKEEFKKLWNLFQKKNSAVEDEKALFHLFQKELINSYCDRFWGMTEKYFSGCVIRSQFYSYSGVPDAELADILEQNPHIDAKSIGTYLNFNNFEAENTDSMNHLPLAGWWFERYASFHEKSKRAKISYEFDATCTQNGYPLAAIGAMYGKHNIQMAAYFTYTPYDVAAWNPGWLVHFMNIAHTPSKAAGFAAAGEIFRSTEPDSFLNLGEEKWQGSHFSIERCNDLVLFQNETVFRYSAGNDMELGNAEKLELISGRGSSRFVQCSGNGFYQIRKLAANTWSLTVFPSQKYLQEPSRGKTNKTMSNRYVNCIREQPVSQLLETKIEFHFNTLRIKSGINQSGAAIHIEENGTFSIPPGEYRLETSLLSHPAKKL